jgi:hypothetical protein
MVNAVRFHNYLATTKIDPGSCRGFENEAFQALFGLVNYCAGTDSQRNAWYQAVWNAHNNVTGGLNAGPNNKSFFYSAVLNRKNSAFGYSLAVPAAGTVDATEYPWALSPAVFNVLNDEVKHGRGLAGVKETKWSDVVAETKQWEDKTGITSPVAVAGWTVISGLVKKYAPRAVVFLIGPEATASAVLLGIGAVAFSNWTIRLNNAAARTNFAIDERRRSFDATSPLIPGEVGS